MSSYQAFAERIVAGGILTDPWVDAVPRLREDPMVLGAAQLAELYRVAQEVAAVYDEVCRMVAARPSLLDDHFAFTPWQKAMWGASAPLWHGIARADVFVTDRGIAVAELNCDTPTGEAEAEVLSALAAESLPGAVDPNRALGDRFCALVELLGRRLVDGDRAPAVGLVYPTELTEDLAVVRVYRRWLERRGLEVILGSPFNLRAEARALALFDRPFSIMLRHYKTDWWGERSSVWDDEIIPDAEPLSAPLSMTLGAVLERRVAVVNPFGAIVPQNKRTMALMWERIHDLSPQAQETVRAHVPESARLEAMDTTTLVEEREGWVLKSDFGAEGDEVLIGKHTSEEDWRTALEHARKGRFIAQRYFEAEVNDRGEVVNHGVFLVAGEAAGIYARASAGPTDARAVSVPVLVEGPGT